MSWMTNCLTGLGDQILLFIYFLKVALFLEPGLMRGYFFFFFLSIFRHHNWTHFLLPADIFIISNELLLGDKDVSTLLLKESLSIAQCGAFKIELSGINEPILPRRPLTPPSLFVQLNVFTVSFSARQGGLPGSLGGTGNS